MNHKNTHVNTIQIKENKQLNIQVAQIPRSSSNKLDQSSFEALHDLFPTESPRVWSSKRSGILL